jgi:MoaA/NifB/PqqE/SkfB family radical SAM enzyme
MQLRYNPTSLIIDQTLLCHQRCYFCHRAVPRKNDKCEGAAHTLPVDLYQKIIDDAVQVDSLRWLSLCGPMGDPCLVPDLVERLNYAKRFDHFRTRLINSNGQALDNHDLPALLHACTDLQISVDSVNEATYLKIHNKGNFARVMENIEALIAAKREHPDSALVNIRFTEGEYNQSEWEQFHQYFEGRVDKVFRVSTHSFMGVQDKYNTYLGATVCNQPFGTVNFNYLGEITTCCINWKLEPSFGSIADTDLKTLWEGVQFERWREKRLDSICSDCGGLGGFQQTKSARRFVEDLIKYSAIKTLSEKRYYALRSQGPSF